MYVDMLHRALVDSLQANGDIGYNNNSGDEA